MQFLLFNFTLRHLTQISAIIIAFELMNVKKLRGWNNKSQTPVVITPAHKNADKAGIFIEHGRAAVTWQKLSIVKLMNPLILARL